MVHGRKNGVLGETHSQGILIRHAGHAVVIGM